MADDFDVFVTAQQAWPAFERAVLNARSDLTAGFRLFDLTTGLRSKEGRAVGRDWFDLLVHVLRKGVRVRLIVSDFDPVVGTDLHEAAWRTVRQGAALAEIAQVPRDQIEIRAALHPCRAGFVPWIGLLPIMRARKQRILRRLRGPRLERQAVGLNTTWLPRINTVTHHQKLAVIDDEILFVGGLDLNERRFDTPAHNRSADQTWSDVQMMVRGRVARQARQHLETFVGVTAGERAVTSLPLLKRTLSAPRRVQFPFLSPRTLLREIEQAHVAAFHRARRLIYIETQFLRSGIIADELARAAQGNPDLRLVMVLPALPDDVAFDDADGLDARYGLSLQRQAVQTVEHAFGDRATFASPVRPVMASRDARSVHAGSPVIYVHNKVLIQDDCYALVGSANLNGRSMRWDTEVAVEVHDSAHLKLLRQKILSHWWHHPMPDEACNPTTLQPWWQGEITRNGVCLPESRSGFLVPYDKNAGREIMQSLPGVTENLV